MHAQKDSGGFNQTSRGIGSDLKVTPSPHKFHGWLTP